MLGLMGVNGVPTLPRGRIGFLVGVTEAAYAANSHIPAPGLQDLAVGLELDLGMEEEALGADALSFGGDRFSLAEGGNLDQGPNGSGGGLNAGSLV